jgi:uncharacterized membrane protein YqjE
MNERAMRHVPDEGPPNLGEVLEDVLLQAKTLVQAELSLAKREIASEVRGTVSSFVVLGVGVMFLQAALTTLGVLLIAALGPGIAAALVVAAFAAIGAVCTVVAIQKLQQRKLPQTSERLALDAKQVVEAVK